MKWKAKSSKSVYKAILQVGQPASEDTGLSVTDRFFIPEKQPGANRVLWAIFDCLVLMSLIFGLLLLIMTGYSLNGLWWVYPAAAMECLLMVMLFRNRWCRKYGKILFLAGVFVLALFLFLLQEPFLQGAKRLGYQVIVRINQVYDGNLDGQLPAGEMTDVGIFLILILIPVVFWIAFSVLKKNQFAYVCLLLFPLLTVIALFGGAISAAALFLTFFGIILCLAYQYPIRRNRMMGGKNRELFEKNERRYEAIQKKSAVLVLAGSIVISICGFYLIRPLLAFSLAPAEKAAMQVQNAVLGRVISLLPDVTGGAYSLQVETVGGGVLDGSLGDTEGYTFSDIEDLKITLSAKPQERLYLKGYVGSLYDGKSWKAPYETVFDGAAMNWNTAGNARLYIQNLPFLRTAYVGEAGAEDAETSHHTAPFIPAVSIADPVQITVERINANDAYTYVPYGAYLNDYYEIQAGDGAVAGQTMQEDQYLLYWKDYRTSLLNSWNLHEDTANVLDRVEESYAAFCSSQYLEVADGLSELQAQVDEIKKEKHWKKEEDLEEITAWIRAYLAENYEFDMKAETVEEDEDFLTGFLFEEKKGYSIHFASAAVELYRMFGIPARYVVGYTASEALFAPQADGTYTAVLEDDNSQAWAEIYVNGIGWQPEDMTPGVIGTLEEVGEEGERISQYTEESEEEKNDEEDSVEEEPEASGIAAAGKTLVQDWTVGQIIRGLLILLLSCAALVILLVWGRRRYLNLGYDFLGKRGNQKAAIGIFHGICRRMRFLGLPETVDSESEEFWEFAEKQMKRNKKYREGELKKMAEKLYASCYGEEALSHRDVKTLRKLYRQLPLWRKKVC